MKVINRNSISKYLLNNDEYMRFYTDNINYLFIAKTLRIFEIKNKYLIEYLNICDSKLLEIKTILSEGQIKDIFRFIKNQISKNSKVNIKYANEELSHITFITTDNCNLNCRYCCATKQKNRRINLLSFDVSKKIIDYLMEYNTSVKDYFITFFGGEPLINIKVIKEIIDYTQKIMVEKNKKSVKYGITTNCTIITSEIIDIFKKYNSEVVISLDGPENIQNLNRPYKNGKGSFKKTYETLKFLKENKIDFYNNVTIPVNIKNIIEILKYHEKEKVNFTFDFAEYSEFRKNDTNSYFKEVFKNIEKQFMLFSDFYFKNILNGEKIYCTTIKLKIFAEN